MNITVAGTGYVCLAEEEGYVLRTVKAAIEVNEKQKFKLISKAIPNIKLLLSEGAEVHAYDPVGAENFKKLYPTQIKYEETPEAAVDNADLCFIFTEWDEIKSMDLDLFKGKMQTPFIYDGRNCFTLEGAKKAGLNYFSIGRPDIREFQLEKHKAI